MTEGREEEWQMDVYLKLIFHRLSLCPPSAFSCCIMRSYRWQACCSLTAYNKFVLNCHVSSAASCKVVKSARSQVARQNVHTMSHLPTPPLCELFVFDPFIDPSDHWHLIGTPRAVLQDRTVYSQLGRTPGHIKLRHRSSPPFPFPSLQRIACTDIVLLYHRLACWRSKC